MNSSSPSHPRSLLTRATLLFRLRDWQDSASWEEFYRLYHKLVYGLSRRSGLAHSEAEEVTQDVFKRVSETIQGFESSPERGSFRGWLMNLTRWRIADKFRCRPLEGLQVGNGLQENTTELIDAMERLPDPRTAYDAAWESEWRSNLLAAALSRVARHVPAKHFQAFDLYARQQWPVLRVARELGINPASVYLISHRLTKRLKTEVIRLESQLG